MIARKRVAKRNHKSSIVDHKWPEPPHVGRYDKEKHAAGESRVFSETNFRYFQSTCENMAGSTLPASRFGWTGWNDAWTFEKRSAVRV